MPETRILQPLAVVIIAEQGAHRRVPEHFMKNCLFNIVRIAVVGLREIYNAVVKHARRRRLDALRRHTSENGLWQITECPDFLDRNRHRPPEALGEGGGDAVDGAVKVGSADGRACFMHDGVRTVFLGTRE